MRFKVIKNTVLLFVITLLSCGLKAEDKTVSASTKVALKKTEPIKPIVVGANRTEAYLPLLEGQRVGVVANQTSVIFKNNATWTHVVDSLLHLNIAVKTVFAPEHGFRGTADAGEVVKNGIDTKTGLPIISLYGKNKKPSAKQLANLDVVIFDIQDVGARFYTYISSLHYVMEACAEQHKTLIVLDRPNPNGHYIDGPILEPEHKSFVGMHPVPVVHGLTIGEYAKMINGEGWLKNKVQCKLTVIKIANYTKQLPYELPIKPSPNLPNATAINLYPSLCFFEGTPISIGRGTNTQFQVIGAPQLKDSTFNYSFTPQPNFGAKYPKHKGKMCYGVNLSNNNSLTSINLNWLITFYNAHQRSGTKAEFFTPFFTKLAGTKSLEQAIKNNWSSATIRKSWQADLQQFNSARQPYLLYQ